MSSDMDVRMEAMKLSMLLAPVVFLSSFTVFSKKGTKHEGETENHTA